MHFNVTDHPTMQWTAQQLVEAFPWDSAPRYLLRDNVWIYGWDFTLQVEMLDIEDRSTSYRSPWQNPYIERLIGSVRRECLDHVIVLGERHLWRVMRGYVEYYNGSRTRFGLAKECPIPREIEPPDDGQISQRLMVGGLHHRYYREAA